MEESSQAAADTSPYAAPRGSPEEDGDYDDDEEDVYLLHNLAEQGRVDRLRSVLPLPSECSEPPPRLSVLSIETSLLEKDDMGFLPLHVAVIHQQADCALHLLRYSPALTSAMLRLKGGDFGTPFLHLILRVGSINASFSGQLINELFSEDKQSTDGGFYGDDVRSLLFEKVAARDEEGNTVFHLCARYDLVTCMDVLASFYSRHLAARQTEERAGVDGEKKKKPLKLETLLEKGNKVGFRALHEAMKYRSAASARKLVNGYKVDVNPITSLLQTPAHIAAVAGFAEGVEILRSSPRDVAANFALKDTHGYTAGQVAHKCGFDGLERRLVAAEADESVTEPADHKEDVASKDQTRFLFHPEVWRHLPMSYHRRGGPDPPPENPERMNTLVDPVFGILRSREFQRPNVKWDHDIERADIAEILRVHEYHYVDRVRHKCASLAASVMSKTPVVSRNDGARHDQLKSTSYSALSVRSFDAATRAAGAVCKAVDEVVAAYARAHFKHRGINKVAILDFDVHHGNGTEEIVRQLVPSTKEIEFETPYGTGKQVVHQYKPWRSGDDSENVFFCSVHGYGHKDPENKEELGKGETQGWFYPGSGVSGLKEGPVIWDEGLPFCHEGASASRLKWRSAFRDRILPKLREFNPDLIFLSAGFDAHKKELVNWGYVSLLEQDYEWLVSHVKRVANSCCDGRLVSVLEGGYNFHGRIISPFARSVAAHTRALINPAQELWDEDEIAKEAAHEQALLANYLEPTAATSAGVTMLQTKKRSKTEVSAMLANLRSKRVRKEVDYVALAKELTEQQ
ncbi:hypothetical protein PInf_008231 [Phytophthora infestans]|nr:hypothetical protein PInf_008231 [Phytophthora infestans]